MKQQSIHTDPDVDKMLERINRRARKERIGRLPIGKSKIANHLIRIGAKVCRLDQEEAQL
jgi:hypothetical protein